jgi:catechol 2,3-dioxygenase-like lactoylglutathione lyase family enzyme
VKLRFLLTPVPDLAGALPFFRDRLGWDEAWREGDSTVAFRLPDSQAQVMVVAGGDDPPGPMYEVPDLDAFLAEHADLPVLSDRAPIPDGSVIGLGDPGGNVFYVFDQIGAEA